MIKKEYICDKCGTDTFIQEGFGSYTIKHESLDGNIIMGDNRIIKDIHFCKNCFGIHIYPILPIKK